MTSGVRPSREAFNPASASDPDVRLDSRRRPQLPPGHQRYDDTTLTVDVTRR
jgi:hypothetical protein